SSPSSPIHLLQHHHHYPRFHHPSSIGGWTLNCPFDNLGSAAHHIPQSWAHHSHFLLIHRIEIPNCCHHLQHIPFSPRPSFCTRALKRMHRSRTVCLT